MTKDNYMTIFLITVFGACSPRKDKYSPYLGSRRSVGFRPTFEMAEEVVKTNMCDIWEYCYDYACIEEIGCELYPEFKKRWYYKYNDNTGGYEEIEEPECLKYYCNIGEIG